MPLAVVVLLVHMGILLICFHLIISPWILRSSGVRHLTTTQETWVQIPGGTFSNGEKMWREIQNMVHGSFGKNCRIEVHLFSKKIENSRLIQHHEHFWKKRTFSIDVQYTRFFFIRNTIFFFGSCFLTFWHFEPESFLKSFLLFLKKRLKFLNKCTKKSLHPHIFFENS